MSGTIFSDSDSKIIKVEAVDSQDDTASKTSADNLSQMKQSQCLILTEGSVSRVMSTYQCVVCLDIITPPILQCQNGHLLCVSCRKSLLTHICPQCGVELSDKDIRNSALEQLAVNLGLKFACPYNIAGCAVTTTLNERLTHQRLCEHRPYECPDIGGKSKCEWTGFRDQVYDHLIDCHKYSVKYMKEKKRNPNTGQEVSSITFECKYDLMTELSHKSLYWMHLINYENDQLLFVTTRDSGPNLRMTFKSFLSYIGEQKGGDKLTYTIEMKNLRTGSLLQFKDSPKSIRQTVSKLMSIGPGLGFDNYMAYRYSVDRKFNIVIEIMQKS